MSPPTARVFHVDIAAVEAQLRTYESWLAPDELAKAARMATTRLHAEWVVTRALARWALSQYVPDVEPRAWELARTEAGKPYVTGPRAIPFEWNLSHAGGLVVCALSASPIGVDVEPRSRGDELVVSAPKMFSAVENAALDALPSSMRAARAVELWTLKEAYLKARGGGISVRLERFGIRAVEHGYALGDVTILNDEPADWQLEIRELSARAEPCVLAIAIRRGGGENVGIELATVVPS